MEAKQESKTNMFRAVEKHCTDYPAIVATVPAFEAGLAELTANNTALLLTIQQEDLVTTGITVNKTESKQALCQQAADVAAQVSAFAASIGNSQLKAEVSFTINGLLKTKDDQISPRCQNIHDQAAANLVALAPYGITDALLKTLQDSITLYQHKVPSPRNAAAEKKTIRTNIKTLIKANDVLLKERMDKTAVVFKKSETDFYNTYKNNRIILDPAVISTELSGTITSQTENSIISKATITVAIKGKVVNITSNSMGIYSSKPSAFGEAIITFSAEGFTSKTIDGFKIMLGKNNVLNVALAKL